MEVSSCYRIGYVMKRHGVQGAVKVRLERTLPEKVESVFIEINKRLIPFFVSRHSELQNDCIFWFEDVSTTEAADELVSSSLYIPKLEFRDVEETDDDRTNFVGFTVRHLTTKLGNVEAIDYSSRIPLMKVRTEGREVIIPIQDHFISKVDNLKRIIDVVLPEGFLEI